MNDCIPCIVCTVVRTSNRDKTGRAVCGTCSNSIYYSKVASGEIVELKLDMAVVKQSTLLLIKSLIAKDKEYFENSKPQVTITTLTGQHTNG